MKKYIILLLFITVLFSTVKTRDVKADFGPKPSLTITVFGIDEPYSFDLLFQENDPFLYTSEQLEDRLQYYFTDSFPEFLNGYSDVDEFSSYYLYGIGGIDRTKNDNIEQEYLLNYYPPSTFKILIVTDAGKLIVSEIITTAAFDTVMSYNLTEVDTSVDQTDVGVVTGNLDSNALTRETILRTLLRVLYTVLIEIGVLYLFKYTRRKSYIIVGATNLVTQIGLSYAVISTAVYSNIMLATIVLLSLEIVVFSVEGLFYFITLKEQSRIRALSYAIVANAASLAIGYIVLIIF